MNIFKYKDFTLTVEDPVCVHRGHPFSEVGWGPDQFPGLSRTDSGDISLTWATGADSIESYE